MKELIEELKLNKVAYLLENIEKRNFDSKLSSFKKIEKMNITKELGIYLINNSTREYGINDNNGGINASLISLCFKNYYDEYNIAIKNIFKDLKPSVQNKVLFLLSTLDNKGALELYTDLILKYYKDSDFIPISNLFERPYLYNFLFPKLYKAFKFKNLNNNILILLNDYLNAGVVPKDDITKNKKIISDCILKIFDEALKYNFKNTFEYLNNESYKNLRFFLEISVNIETYVSNSKTKEKLKQILKKKDNQLNLFILDNFIKKNELLDIRDIKKISKDECSRYPLYELLISYNKNDIINKLKLSKESLAKSDFYINFCIHTNYKNEPKNIELIKIKNINNYDYYVYKFNVIKKYNSNDLTNNLLTNYIVNIAHLEKYNGQDIINTYIGVSGGYDPNSKLSPVIFKHTTLLFDNISENDNIDIIVNNLVNKDFNTPKKKIDKNKKHHNIFSLILLILFFIYITMFIFCIIFINNYESSFNSENDYIKPVKLTDSSKYIEINGKEIFSKEGNIYYILFYKKTGNKSKYYNYINEYNKRNIKFYFVNMNNKDNDFLYSNNDLNIIISKDRLLKVNNGDYEYYVDGKQNILNEMKKEIDEFIKKENQKK